MILEKALQGKFKILIRVPNPEAKDHLNEWLWTYRDDGFLPHGVNGEEHEAQQPILITDQDNDNPNDANMLVLTDGCVSDSKELDKFDLCCEMLNGHVDEHVQNARARWKDYKDKGYEIAYWAQDEQGRWTKKA
jgi:DNA polymerase-3 subunit chi